MIPALLASCGGKTDKKSTSGAGGDSTNKASEFVAEEDKGESYKFAVKPRDYTTSQTITVSGPAAQAKWLQGILDGFNTQWVAEGGAAITWDVTNHEEDKVDSEVADWSTGPDVYAFSSDKIMGLFQAGALAPLPANTVKEYKLNLIDVVDSDGAKKNSLDVYGKFSSKYCAYPYNSDNGYFLYYDKSLMNEEDVKTMEGILAKCSKERQLRYDLGTAYYTMGALFSDGARYNYKISRAGVMSNVTADFDTKGLVPAKAMVNILSNTDKVAATLAAPNAKNGVGAVVDGSWNAKAYKSALGENYGCAKLPTVHVQMDSGEKKDMQLWSFLGYKNYGVNPIRSSGDAPRLALAHEVARYLTSGKVQKARFEEFNVAPSNKFIGDLEEVKKDEHIKAINEQSQFAIPQTAVPGKAWTAPTVMMTEINQMIADGQAITEAKLQELLTAMNVAFTAEK